MGDLEIDTDGFIANGFAGYQLESNGFVYGLKATSGTAVTRATTQASSPKGALTARLVPVSVLP